MQIRFESAEKASDNANNKTNARMDKLIITISIVTLITSCDSTTKKKYNMKDNKNQMNKTSTSFDTTPKVTGIGGIFFFSEDKEKTKDWYSKNLGLEINQWGSSFEFRNANRPEEINYLQWSLFKKGSEYFSPSKKEFMINYRVQNIEGLVNKLLSNGVSVLDNIETFDYGKFVHVMDNEGNKIELWEPVDTVFTAMGRKTTK